MSRQESRPPNVRGFTLVETMVAVTITALVAASLVQMLQVGQKSAERNQTLVDMQQNARCGLESLSEELRHVSYGKDPTQPSIQYAGPDSVTFVADVIPEHGGAEVISFYLSGQGDPDTPNPNDTILMRVVSDTSGVALISAPQAYGIAPDGLHFRWYNGGGVELPNPVPQPEQVGEIYVSLTAASAAKLGDDYRTLTLSSTIYPRNLPLSPARSRPSSPGCNPLTFPNCESATMSWTTPTTNTDGTELPLSDISHFCLYYGTDPDELSLYTRLARTINEWTISGLEAGDVYYLAVTCASRSGVESYMCTR
jgi:prepilin-type N-terminal cleavage/methylation domain-containing protein